jgi:hypothetical protein
MLTSGHLFHASGAGWPDCRRGSVAHLLPSIPRMSRIATARPGAGDFEIVIGRGLAFCAHPAIAWRRLPPAGKALLLAAYAGASYISVLTVLLLG